MARDKYEKKGGKMLAPADQIEIKQQKSAPTRYSGMLASADQVVIKQQQNAKDTRY